MARKRPIPVSKPTYPGGVAALRQFVAENVNYPAAARAAGVEGTVTVRYSVDYRGHVVATRIKRGLGYGCDEEAARVVALLRFDVYSDRKKKVRIHQDLNVHFRLPAPAENPPAPGATITPTAGGYVIRW